MQIGNETKIRMISLDGDIVIDDFDNRDCHSCILSCCKEKEIAAIVCPVDGLSRKRIFNRRGKTGLIQICDGKEKNKNNFIQMAELVWHNMQRMIHVQQRVREQETERINSEISVFKHNIETINGESILEFESAVPTKRLRNNYKEIVKVVKEAIDRQDSTMPSFIARQALNNQRIQTEILVSKIIGDRYDSKSTFSNPWDAVMTNVYLLYPLAKKRSIDIMMGQYASKFNIDFNATKVASYYILDNAIKYALPNSQIQVDFIENNQKLFISFKMKSPLILPEETEAIFERGYRGKNAVAINTTGSGFGLFCAKKLMKSAFAAVSVKPGHVSFQRDGIEYADNDFSIVLPMKLQPWKSSFKEGATCDKN